MMFSHPPHRKSKSAGSILELMIVVAVGSSLLAAAFMVVTNVGRATTRQKLMADVAVLNTSVKLYEANGGDLSKATGAEEVIRRLKTRSSNGIVIAGLRGTFVDPRLEVVNTEKEGDARAVWDAVSRRFIIKTEGIGVAHFVMSEDAAAKEGGTEERGVALELAKRDKWIWDYTDRSTAALPAPGSSMTTSYATPGETGETFGRLASPELSSKGGTYPLSAYPMNLTLTNPNPQGSSRIVYSLEPGEWKIYTGGAIQIIPDSSIEIYVESLDSLAWASSGKVLEYFGVEQIPLEVAFAFPESAYSYKELGGAMVPGSQDTGYDAPRGIVQITNRNQFAGLLQEGMIVLRASVNGGDEMEVPILWNSLSGTFELNLGHFGARDWIDVSARAVSRSSLFGHSKLSTSRIGADVRRLLSPEIKEQARPDGLFIYGEHFVEINLVTETGEIPEGSRIYYTTDGTDPGVNASGPTSPSARPYEGPFLAVQADGQPITARVYAPGGQENWFIPSTESQIVWPLVVSVGFTMSASTNAPAAGVLGGLEEALSAP